MEWYTIHEIVYGLIVLSILLSLSWFFYYSRYTTVSKNFGIYIDQRAATLQKAEPDVKTSPPSYEEATNTGALRHRNSIDTNLTSDDVNHEDREVTAQSSGEETTTRESTRGDGNKNANESKETDLTINNDETRNIVQSNSKANEVTGSEYENAGSSSLNDDKSQITEDVNAKCVSVDENIHECSKEDNNLNQMDVKDDVKVESDGKKCDSDNVSVNKDSDDSNKKLDNIEDAKCENKNNGKECRIGEDVGLNVDSGDTCKDKDNVSSTSNSEGQSISGGGGKDLVEDEVSVSSQCYDTASDASTKYDTASGGSGVTME